MSAPKPAYREIERWSPSNHPRGGAKVTNFFLHTEEGNSTAESLAAYLQDAANEVSYHYTVDNAVTVCDVVDTDMCSWAVLDANPISVNLCFAGSRASWTRAQWLDRMGRAIEVAAWLAVQDARKYSFPTAVITPPYRRGAGISDHRYVTRVLGMGTHTDVGDGFPWDVFTGHVQRFTTANGGPIVPAPNTPLDAQTAAGLALDQLAGPGTARGADFPGWPQLGGRTVVEALGAIGEKLGIPGFKGA